MAKKTSKKNILKNLRIKNFRCFENFELKNLKRVNIFVGDNNSGKSSVLEAVGFLYPTVRNYMDIVVSRESSIYRHSAMIGISTGRFQFSKLDYLFHKKKTDLNKIQISSELNDSIIDVSMSISKDDIFLNRNAMRRYGGEAEPIFKEDIKTFVVDYKYKKISQQIGFSNIGAGKSSIDGFEEYDIELLFDSIPSTKEVTMKWNKIIENSGLEAEAKYIKLLQKFDPEITNIRTKLGEDLLFFKKEGYETNLSNMGNGFKKFFDILLTAELMSKRSDKLKILCIDEIDNGLYHDKQDLFWEQIIKLCEEYNIQLFATTHSYDSLKNISKIALNDKYEDVLQVVRLEKFDGKILQTKISQEELETMIDNHYEIR
jgi:AAA15 family ATPase/GTPase